MKAIEIPGEFNEEEDDEPIQHSIQNYDHINHQQIQDLEGFKQALIQLDQDRIARLVLTSEEGMYRVSLNYSIRQAAVLEHIEQLKKDRQDEKLQFMSKIFNQIPLYTQRVQQIVALQNNINIRMEQLRKKKSID